MTDRRRRLVLKMAAGVVLASQLGGTGGMARPAPIRPHGTAATRDRPNILLILVDDLKPALHCYGDPVAVTPNLDRLAARGTRFDLAYANEAVCAPSRMNLMTGARSTSSGIYNFGENLRDYLPDAVTLPQYLQAAGYHTESGGKVYHIGHGTVDDKRGWSVPHHRDKLIEYLDPGSTKGQPTQEEALFEDVPTPGGDPFTYARSLAKGAAWERLDVPDDAYADGRTADWAIGRLRTLEAGNQPFFLAVGFARPHLPFTAPKRYWDLYDPAQLRLPRYERLPEGMPRYAGKIGGEIEAYREVPTGMPAANYPVELKRTLIHGYYAGVSYTDAQIGKMLAELDRSGLARNTIVVVWGDHGFHLGDHGIWTKHTNLEQATRIPLIFAGPGIRPRAVTKQLAETVDLYPTLAGLAKLPRPPGPQAIDGVDLRSVLRDPARRVRNFAYHSYPRGDRVGQAIRTERFRLVRWTNEKTGEIEDELYDLVSDPGETRNLAQARPATRARLLRILASQPRPVSVNYRPSARLK